jgi:hypothetical protein
MELINHFLVLFPNAGDPSRCSTGTKCNSKFRNNAVLASYKQPNPCCYQVLFNFLRHPPHMENSHHQQGRLHESPTSSVHKKINLVLKYSANEVSFSDPAIVKGIRFIE